MGVTGNRPALPLLINAPLTNSSTTNVLVSQESQLGSNYCEVLKILSACWPALKSRFGLLHHYYLF